MSKVTSKYQVTLPRNIARAHRIEPGSELQFISSGDSLRVLVQPSGTRREDSLGEALASFDAATQRQDERNAAALKRVGAASEGRGWARADLYEERTEPR